VLAAVITVAALGVQSINAINAESIIVGTGNGTLSSYHTEGNKIT